MLTETPGINRKQLLEKMLPAESAPEPEELEKKKLTLASDLRWLIGEGHVIEFNDGALDVSRTKPSASKPKAQAEASRKTQPTEESAAAASEIGSETAPAAEGAETVPNEIADATPAPAPAEEAPAFSERVDPPAR